MLTAKTSTKGQIVIPKPMRDRLGIKPGARVALKLADGLIEISPLPEDPVKQIRGSLKSGTSLADRLIKEHRLEVKRDAGRR